MRRSSIAAAMLIMLAGCSTGFTDAGPEPEVAPAMKAVAAASESDQAPVSADGKIFGISQPRLESIADHAATAKAMAESVGDALGSGCWAFINKVANEAVNLPVGSSDSLIIKYQLARNIRIRAQAAKGDPGFIFCKAMLEDSGDQLRNILGDAIGLFLPVL